MPTELNVRAVSIPKRSFPYQTVLVVCLLSMLFAMAVIASLAPHPIVDAALASMQGGL